MFCDWLIMTKDVIGSQRRIFIFSFGGVDKYLGGDAAACFGRGLMATPGKAKEKV
jgi:hypothetical protein